MKAPIKQQLANIVLLEFPVVLFSCYLTINFEVIKDVTINIHKSLKKDSEGNQSLEGKSFKEEVIEDDNSSADPQVFDLMKHVESSSSQPVLTQNMSSEKAPDDSSDKPLLEENTLSNLSHSSVKTKEPKLSEDTAFDGFLC